MKKQLLTVLTLVTVLVFGGSGTASAAAQTVEIDDPIGDVANNFNNNGAGNEKGPAYFDIVHAAVTGGAGASTMSMRLAAPVPLTPPNPTGNPGFDFWLFALDTQAGSDPKGYPFSPGVARPFEQFVFLTWDGTAFHSYTVDRTPLVSGGEAVITDIPFSFNAARDEITFVFDEALIGSPAEFNWIAVSGVRESHFGTKGLQGLDVAGPINWP